MKKKVKKLMKKIYRKYLKKYPFFKKIAKMIRENTDTTKGYNILLLTNRDSDNVGDQVIEATDIGLLGAAMKNLGIKQYKINSRAAGIVSKKYMETKEPRLLKSAEKAIQKADVVVFGGAPLFNYKYQPFYERTAVTLELAQKYNKPVLFSAIGVEGYDDDNKKCQRLKKTLNFDCVKQITTRDDFEKLEKYKENENLVIEKVSDPAVFTSRVFKNYISEKEEKKVGIFVLRGHGFKDNGFDFSRDDSAEFWKRIVSELEKEGYDYELLTSGHFGDEAFLDYLIRNHGIDAEKCVFNVNTPEFLIEKISSYDAVVSCRLHPSIISFSLDVPSLGIVWNYKVKHFYESIGYADRVIEVENLNPQSVVKKIGEIIDEGVKKDNDYLWTVYNTIFNGLKNIINPEEHVKAYNYEELLENIPGYEGTTEKEFDIKLKRKFRRTYEKYNSLFEKNIEYQNTIKKLKKEIENLKEK